MESILFELVGGLGIFLFGMKRISSGMQKIAGYKIKSMLEKITSNLYRSISFGVISTTLIQSSSVVTCLVVALVNSKLLTLNQSLGIILGTNIGTTITGWLFTLKIDQIGIPIVAISSLGYIYSKSEKNRIRFLTFLGLGLVFLGLFSMGSALKPLRNNSDFIDIFKNFSSSSGIGVVKTVFVGAILTGVVQSSSAVLGIIITLLNQELIPFEVALFLVIGANIGTTITPIISSVGGSLEGKKTAFFCTLIKIFQGVWALLFFPLYIGGLEILFENISQAQSVALYHTLINIVNVFLFIPVYKIFVKFLERKKSSQESVDIRVNKFLKVTSLSMWKEQKGEFLKIVLMVKEIIFKIERELEDHELSKKNIESVEKLFDEINQFQKESEEITFNFFKTAEKKGATKKVMSLLKGIKDLKELSFYFLKISKKIYSLKKMENGEYELAKIKNYHRLIVEDYDRLIEALKLKDYEKIYEGIQRVKLLEISHKKLKNDYEKYLDDSKELGEREIYFLEVLIYYKRINFHLRGILEIKINKYL